MRKQLPAFTLVEVLLVIALIAVLAGLTFVAINPGRNFADARNTQRKFDVGEIASAVTQYIGEQGNTIAGLGTIATCPAVSNVGTGGVDLGAVLVDKYIPAIPTDPSGGTAADTGYDICQSTNSRITVSAPNAENGATVSVKR